MKTVLIYLSTSVLALPVLGTCLKLEGSIWVQGVIIVFRVSKCRSFQNARTKVLHSSFDRHTVTRTSSTTLRKARLQIGLEALTNSSRSYHKVYGQYDAWPP